MRLFSLLSVYLFSFAALGANVPADYSLTCTTSVAGATLYAHEGRMHFHLEDSAGFQNFPIYSGVVTPSVLSIVERGAIDLKDFDGEVNISWDLDKCKIDPARPALVACGGIAIIETPANVPIVATSMSTSTNVIDSLDVKAQVVDINLGFSTMGDNFMHYFIQFPFDFNHCSIK